MKAQGEPSLPYVFCGVFSGYQHRDKLQRVLHTAAQLSARYMPQNGHFTRCTSFAQIHEHASGTTNKNQMRPPSLVHMSYLRSVTFLFLCHLRLVLRAAPFTFTLVATAGGDLILAACT